MREFLRQWVVPAIGLSAIAAAAVSLIGLVWVVVEWMVSTGAPWPFPTLVVAIVVLVCAKVADGALR